MTMRLQHVGISVPPESIQLARTFYRDLLDCPSSVRANGRSSTASALPATSSCT